MSGTAPRGSYYVRKTDMKALDINKRNVPWSFIPQAPTELCKHCACHWGNKGDVIPALRKLIVHWKAIYPKKLHTVEQLLFLKKVKNSQQIVF